MKISTLLRPVIAPVAGLFLAATPLLGEVYFYEDFNYAVGETLHGKSGGTGFKSGASWTMQDDTYSHAVISDKTLSYNLGGTLLTSEQSVRVTGIDSTTKPFATYQFDTPHNVQEFYVSFLVSASEWVPGGQIGIALGLSATTVNHQSVVAGTGGSGPRWQSNVGAGSPANVFSGTELNETHLIVVRFYKEDSLYFNKASIWVDPDSAIQGAPDATASKGASNFGAFGYLNILNYSSGNGDFNIGRIVGGSSWNDVITPIPEPGTVTLVLGGTAACLLMLRSRRTNREPASKV